MVDNTTTHQAVNQDHIAQVGLAVSAGDRLRFGAFFPGEMREVLPTSDGAASFEIFGAANAEVEITLSCPAALSDGGNSIGIQFGHSSAALNAANDRYSAIPFNPQSSSLARLGPNGYLYVFVGGIVPATTEEPGNYFADITLEVAYAE